jgi:hypothetical protein
MVFATCTHDIVRKIGKHFMGYVEVFRSCVGKFFTRDL